MKPETEVAIETDEKEKNELTPENGARIFTLSFRFSQGNVKLQELLFFYLRILHPEWRMNAELMNKIASRVKPAMEAYLLTKPGKLHTAVAGAPFTKETIARETEKQLAKLKEALNTGAIPRADFVKLPQERTNRNRDFKRGCKNRPFFSFAPRRQNTDCQER